MNLNDFFIVSSFFLVNVTCAHPERALFRNLPPSPRLRQDKRCQIRISILEILKGWMPVPITIGMVEILIFLDLAKNYSFPDGYQLIFPHIFYVKTCLTMFDFDENRKKLMPPTFFYINSIVCLSVFSPDLLVNYDID
jgi:hypothetical protein